MKRLNILMFNQNSQIKIQTIQQWPKEKGQTTINKTLHRKLKMDQHEHHKNRGPTQVHKKRKQSLLH